MSSVQMRGARSRLSRFAHRLLTEWERQALPCQGTRAVVAVSGGADSVALLLAFNELVKAGRLEVRLTVAHLNHGLRGQSGAEDAQWVKALAGKLGFPFEHGHVTVGKRAAEAKDNLEQAARRARYEFLIGVAERLDAGVILTGHTLDDQAETVLLRLVRGSGAEGLGGIEPVRMVEADGDILLVRPLVSWARRAETESYCRERGVEFRADAMNEDERFARVRVRRKLLPLLETFNPRVVESLARTAELLREDSVVLNAAAEELLRAAGESCKKDEESASDCSSLSVNVLARAPASLRRRALRLWIKRGRGDLRRLELAHLAGVEKLLEGERGGRVAELPGQCFVERRRGRLFLKSRIQNPEFRSQNKKRKAGARNQKSE